MFFLFITFLFVENITGEVISDFNSIQHQPRKFNGKIFVVVENDREIEIANEHNDRIDQIIIKGFSIDSIQTGFPKVQGVWNYSINSKERIAHIKFDNFVNIINLSFEVANSIVEFVRKYNLDGICLEDLENLFYITGRSTRDPRSVAISGTIINSLQKYIDEFIIDTTDYYSKSLHSSHCSSPLMYIENLIKDCTSKNENLKSITSISIDLSGYKFCPNQLRSSINVTSFQTMLHNATYSTWIEECQEHSFTDSNNCEIMFPTIEYIKKRIDLAILEGIDITLCHIEAAHPNVFELF
ncbi:hypothetical protein ENU1_105850 [Entamoeba nuttalli P19]|uniref:Uncharacterized protein n=1 Tax=Entamoeba nuttalli (strain P19) TaxID=1076696 RepID=K2HBG8_ENTNP|nr:hypothetical protein ENU1_105850 [Entamoeba nuttalli P19]EKE40009.1 hypothetical protein ENU1_105850 [Entamoeba nuttalli P19]|eukprot:XP_008857657.1 hypothetical protein ENU1_105850 [Entamoeba nuttalli P19]